MSRLIPQIDELLKEIDGDHQSSLFDFEIICYDGTIYWNQFLMASISSTLSSVMKDHDDMVFSLVLPDFPTSSIRSLLEQSLSIDHEHEILTEEELMVFNLLSDTQCWAKFEKNVQFKEAALFPSKAKINDLRGSSVTRGLELEDQKLFPCNIGGCSAQFSRRLHLERHQSTKHNKNKSTEKLCDSCGKVFFHSDSLKLHMKYHQDVGKNYSCLSCNEIFKGRRALQCHIKDHHTNKQACGICKKLIKKRFLPKHMRLKHSTTLVSSAEKRKGVAVKNKQRTESVFTPVNDTTTSEDAVQDLIENQLKRVKCPNCDKTFTDRYNAKYHNEKVHLNISPSSNLSCSVCEKKFNGPASRLARHIRECHLGKSHCLPSKLRLKIQVFLKKFSSLHSHTHRPLYLRPGP